MKMIWEKITEKILWIVALIIGVIILKFAFTFLYESGKVIFKNLFS